MIHYFAGQSTLMHNLKAEEALARIVLNWYPVYPRLISFRKKTEIMSVINLKKKPDIADKIKIMLDCGAWSLLKQKAKIDMDSYIEFIDAHQEFIDFSINLDIISDGQTSFQNYMYMRKQGLNPLPVYHTDTPIEYLGKYIKQTDYICISVIGRKSEKSMRPCLDYLWERYLIDGTGNPLTRVHGLGISSIPIIRDYPWHSVDSSAWARSSVFGAIVVPKEVDGIFRYDLPLRTVPISLRRKALKNHISNLPPEAQESIVKYVLEIMRKGARYEK